MNLRLRLHSGLMLLFCLLCVALVPNFVAAATSCEVNLTIPSQRTSIEERAEWLERTFAFQAPSFIRADNLGAMILQMPPAQQERWLEAIARAYPVVAKGWQGPPPAPHAIVAGKRVLDRVLFWIQSLDVKLESLGGVAGTRTAYLKILADQVKLFNTLCTEADVALVVERFQGVLKSWQTAHPTAPSRYLLIGGSFVNGKWRPGSDIDVSFSDGAMVREMMPAFRESVRAGLSPGCEPTVSGHMEPASFYGKLNAFVLEVRSSFARLHVFRPAVTGSGLTPTADSSGKTFDF